MVVYRLIQEALTNAVKYAGDGPIDVQLIYSPTAITVFVDDEGPGAGGHGATRHQGAVDTASLACRNVWRPSGAPWKRDPAGPGRAGGCMPASRS